jgi:hypothetical protein
VTKTLTPLLDAVAMRAGECHAPRLAEVENLGDNIWRGPFDEIFWFDGSGWFDESEREWVQLSEVEA